MADWLKLTPEDIEASVQQAQTAPPTPAVLAINADDLTPAVGSTAVENSLLRITTADITPVPPQNEHDPDLVALETLMFGLLNSARQQHLPRWLGNPNLQWHVELAAVARGHAADMLKRQYVNHTSPEGIKVARRITQYGVSYMACGENIGVVYGDAAHGETAVYAIHNAYMNQPRRLTNHRGNLLNPIWTHVGIGAAYDPHGAFYITQNFIRA